MTIDTLTNNNHLSRQKSIHGEQPSLLSRYHFLSAKITVNHWQLRDLIQPSSTNRNEILYTYDDTIRSTDRSTDKVSTVCRLDFHPRCFSELDGKFVTGSLVGPVNTSSSNIGSISSTNMNNTGVNIGNGSNWRGLFSFHDRDTQVSSTIRLGSYINNSVSIDKVSNNQYSSYVCNNDMSLYNAEISNSRISVLDSISLDFPLNHSVLSDDHKNLIAVGDCSSIYLLHPGENNNRLRNDHTIDTNCDSGFSTSFDGSGVHFATCFQDGTCLIYDLRNYSQGPLHRIYSTRRNTSSGAFRCVKYSRGTDDLLVVSEHVGRVHVVDTRDFNNHQVIMLPMNSVPSRSVQASSASLTSVNDYTSMFDPSSSSVFVPKILNYNDVLSYEGTFNPNNNSGGNGFYGRNNYNSRSLNNFNVLNALNNEMSSTNEEHSDQHGPGVNSLSSFSEFDYTDNEISGVDWYEDDAGSHVIIGCDRGLINWDIDSWSRRSFPSFSLA